MTGTAFAMGGRGIGAAVSMALGAALLVPLAAAPAAAQTLAEMKDAMEIMVSTSATCSDYLKRPEILADMRETARGRLTGVGMAEAEADSFMDGVVAAARAETMNETQKQVACEIINIRALPVE